MTLRLVAGTIADADVAGPLRFVGRVDLRRVEVNTTRPLVAFHGMLRLARGAVIAVREVEAGTLRGTLFDPWLPELALPCHALGIAIAEADSSGPTFPRVVARDSFPLRLYAARDRNAPSLTIPDASLGVFSASAHTGNWVRLVSPRGWGSIVGWAPRDQVRLERTGSNYGRGAGRLGGRFTDCGDEGFFVGKVKVPVGTRVFAAPNRHPWAVFARDVSSVSVRVGEELDDWVALRKVGGIESKCDELSAWIPRRAIANQLPAIPLERTLRFERGPDRPHPSRFLFSATALDEHTILVAGGVDVVRGNLAGTSATLLYDTRARTWRDGPPMREAREEHSATLLADGRVLVVGGRDGTRHPIATAELFDPRRGTWTAAATLATPRFSHDAVRLQDGRVLVLGGDDDSATVQIYDPRSDLWGAVLPSPVVRSPATATLLDDGSVFVYSGAGAPAIFDPRRASWREVAGSARDGHVATRLADGRLLVAGGIGESPEHALYYSRDGRTKTVGEIIDPTLAQYRVSTKPDHSAPSAFPSLLQFSDGRVLLVRWDSNAIARSAKGTWSRVVPPLSPGGRIAVQLDGKHGVLLGPEGSIEHVTTK